MILEELKSQTRALHERVEGVIAIPNHLGSRESYKALLVRFLGLYLPLEKRLEDFPELRTYVESFGVSSRHEQIAHDLRELGLSAAQIQEIPVCDRLPVIDGTAAALGCTYVLEGASLGGQMIAGMMRKKLPWAAENACSFFTGAGADTRKRWDAFRAFLVDYVASTPGSEPEIISGATNTFLAFEDWFLSKDAVRFADTETN